MLRKFFNCKANCGNHHETKSKGWVWDGELVIVRGASENDKTNRKSKLKLSDQIRRWFGEEKSPPITSPSLKTLSPVYLISRWSDALILYLQIRKLSLSDEMPRGGFSVVTFVEVRISGWNLSESWYVFFDIVFHLKGGRLDLYFSFRLLSAVVVLVLMKLLQVLRLKIVCDLKFVISQSELFWFTLLSFPV